tara:strand:+ start:2331 stop:2840 length:510 start_codon:yes stop_codon:yes gene_type:complete
MENLLKIGIGILVLYIILWLRYKFKFDSENTLYIEDREVEIRINNQLTLYENPVIPHSKMQNFQHNNIKRYFYPILLYCNLPKNMLTHVFLFHPSDTPYLETSFRNIRLFELSQSSDLPSVHDVNLEKYPDFKKSSFIELPISGEQYLFVPAGWWIYTDTPQKFTFSVF